MFKFPIFVLNQRTDLYGCAWTVVMQLEISPLCLDATSHWLSPSTWQWVELQLGLQARGRLRLPKTWDGPWESWCTCLTAPSRWTTRWASVHEHKLLCLSPRTEPMCVRSMCVSFHLCLCQRYGMHLSLKLSTYLYALLFSSLFFSSSVCFPLERIAD